MLPYVASVHQNLSIDAAWWSHYLLVCDNIWSFRVHIYEICCGMLWNGNAVSNWVCDVNDNLKWQQQQQRRAKTRWRCCSGLKMARSEYMMKWKCWNIDMVREQGSTQAMMVKWSWYLRMQSSRLVECSSRYDFVVPGFQLCLHQG